MAMLVITKWQMPNGTNPPFLVVSRPSHIGEPPKVMRQVGHSQRFPFGPCWSYSCVPMRLGFGEIQLFAKKTILLLGGDY